MKLILVFTLVPAIELYLLLKIGSVIGALHTFLLIVFTGVLGASMAKREGFAVLTRLSEEAQRGFPTGLGVVEGLLILVGGLLLLTPGILTDLVGFSLILGPTRKPIAVRTKAWLLQNATFQGGNIQFGDLKVGRPPSEKESSDPFRHPRA